MTIAGISAALVLLLVAVPLYLRGVKAEQNFRTTLSVMEKQNKSLKEQIAQNTKEGDAKVAMVEQKRKSIKTTRQAASVLSAALPSTGSDPAPVAVANLPSKEDAARTEEVVVLSPEGAKRAADRELECQETEIKLSTCQQNLSLTEQMEKNDREVIAAAKKVHKPGFFSRVWTVTKIAVPAVAIGIALDRVVLKRWKEAPVASQAH
jgi:hypothetical protein